MSEYAPNWVNKIDVAVRQIRVAVRLHFEECDPVALHTLVAATHRMISDLRKHKGGRSVLDSAVKVAAKFFKHADKDPDGRVNIEPLPTMTQDLLMDAVSTLQGVAPQIPVEAKLWAMQSIGS
jgi:hypothetical protein